MKRLIVCFDGTWNSADGDGSIDTNVVKLSRAIHATQNTGGVPQIVLYLRGVGSTGVAIERMLAGATGEGIDENIRSAYMFLAQNYVPATPAGPADEIFVFGFSRGAFSARSLVGFIGAAGLVKRQYLGSLRQLWDYYRKPPKQRDAATIVAIDRHDGVRVKCLGVWDTVGSLGVPTGFVLSERFNAPYQFHDTSPSRIVDNAFHALAIDEFRDEFVPTLWTGTAPDGAHIEQVWFAGAHSDVGGGYAAGDLANIPLVWMAEKAEGCGLVLDWRCLPDKTTLDPHAPRHESRWSWSRKDRLTPTIRQVCGRDVAVSVFEKLYRPMDDSGEPLSVINETVHGSVTQRHVGKALLIDDPDAPAQQEDYHPRNL
jgi:uncharacterized protein (DUF2235 family)